MIETDIPARLDALPFARFHKLVIAALGVTWILDGLEVTLAGAVGSVLQEAYGLRLSAQQVGLSASFYLAGAVLGALFFGWLTDRIGRKKLFFITLGVYLAGTAATAFSFDFASYAAFRFVVGAGIGGEYAAVNSTIQELIPARMRGFTDLAINGGYWLGAGAGALASIYLLDPTHIDPRLGWRACFLIGALLGSGVFLLRLWIPESPRWLLAHGRLREAEAIVASIEESLETKKGGAPAERAPLRRIKLEPRGSIKIADIARVFFTLYPKRTAVALALMASQALLYNAIFFTYALILSNFYGVPHNRVGWHLAALAAGNFLGPLALGRYFDTLGRRRAITATYALSGALLVPLGYLFQQGVLDADQQTGCWMVVFFFASAAASSAYLTVSEIFPVEIRALAIAFFYAFGTMVGGVMSPWLFGALIGIGSRELIFGGYGFAAALMVLAGALEWRWGVDAERKPLEEVSRPLSALD